MGSFQITYDDFTGGHYMGNRSTSIPSNTWKGTNAILSPRGDLVPSGAKQIATIAKPTDPVGNPITSTKICDVVHTNITATIIFITYFTDIAPYPYISRAYIVDASSPPYSTVSFGLTGQLFGKVSYDNFRTGSNPAYSFTYLDWATGDVRQYNNVSGTDTRLLANPFGTSGEYNPSSLYKVGYRLVTHSKRKLFYSAALNAASWSSTDYYEFPDTILNVHPRPNDFLVVTPSGLYSVTGVLGESVNIQLIVPGEQIFRGYGRAIIDGRSLLMPDEGMSVPGYVDGAIYQLYGSEVAPIATLDQSDIVTTMVEHRRSTEQIILGNSTGNQVVCWARNGVAWFRNKYGVWSRFFPSGFVAPTYNVNYQYQAGIARSVPGPEVSTGDNRRIPVDEYTVVACVSSTHVIQVIRYINNHVFPNSNDFSWDLSTSTASTPASATVDLPEYWHDKPMVVKEVIIEVGFDTANSLNLTGDAVIQPFIKPTGIEEKGPNDTGAFVSSTQTETIPLSSINADNSNAIYGFRINNAGKGYGFYPRITWQGCRIRRVICICED